MRGSKQGREADGFKSPDLVESILQTHPSWIFLLPQTPAELLVCLHPSPPMQWGRWGG